MQVPQLPPIYSPPNSSPDIDPAPTDAARALLPPPPPPDAPPHPSLPELIPPKFSPLIQTELDRLSRGDPPVHTIDTTRYSAPSTLQDAYIASSFLTWRRTDLQLLETYGKNAWLIANSQVEGILKANEVELERVKKEAEEVNVQRKAAQVQAGGELEVLERKWRNAVEGLVRVEVANEMVRRETEDVRRKVAGKQ